MTIRLFALFAFFSWLAGANPARAEHDVGNPGDPIRLLVAQAKSDAAVIVLTIRREDADAIGNAAVRDFLFEDQQAFADRILQAVLSWSDADRAHCAETHAQAHEISLSYPACARTLRTPKDATLLLLHEATHQAGIADEEFADGVALTAYGAWIQAGLNRAPRWDAVDLAGAPAERALGAAVWTGTEMLAWGGCRREPGSTFECGTFYGDGAALDPVRKAWTPLPAPTPEATGLPAQELARARGSAVWTGTAMLVFGGCSGASGLCDQSFASTLVYDAPRRTWSAVPGGDGAPSARVLHQAVWTGKEMIVWGGAEQYALQGRGVPVNTGGILDLAARRWRPMATAGAPSPRRYFSSVWTGDKLIVWGGCDAEIGRYCAHYFGDGGIYDPAADAWTPIPATPLLPPRARHTAVWTGERMIVWGGQQAQRVLGDGAAFDPKTGRWTPISSVIGTARLDHSAVWTGDRMIVFGGLSGLDQYVADAAQFTPGANDGPGSWSAVATPEAPVARHWHAAFWTGRAMLVWGGESQSSSFLNSGALLIPK